MAPTIRARISLLGLGLASSLLQQHREVEGALGIAEGIGPAIGLLGSGAVTLGFAQVAEIAGGLWLAGLSGTGIAGRTGRPPGDPLPSID